MKLAIFDIGQTLILNQESYATFVEKQITKLLPELIPNILASEDLVSDILLRENGEEHLNRLKSDV